MDTIVSLYSSMKLVRFSCLFTFKTLPEINLREVEGYTSTILCLNHML